WPNAARGRAAPPTGIVPAGPKIPARSPGGYVVRRRSCGYWASTLHSVAKAGPEAGSSECVQLGKIPSAPSAASATMNPGSRQPPPPPAGHLFNDTCCPQFGRPVPRSASSSSQRPTMLTVLTQTPAFGGLTADWRRPGGLYKVAEMVDRDATAPPLVSPSCRAAMAYMLGAAG